MTHTTVLAIVWDFDNTLVDTGARNRSVTRRIVTHITGRDPDQFAVLRGQRAYDYALHHQQNWQDLYADEFGLAPDEIRRAGRLWSEFQLADRTPTPWFAGVPDAIARLQEWPQGIVSLNTRDNIEANLAHAGMSHAFRTVVGCGEVPYDRQKPNPDGLMQCVESLTGGACGTVVYVGDHPFDSECAHNAEVEYARSGRDVQVVSVAATYGNLVGDEPWPITPRHRADEPREIVEIVFALAT